MTPKHKTLTAHAVIISAAALVAIALLLFLHKAVEDYRDNTEWRKPDTVRIEEDEPGWNCETHGNLRCGTPTPGATR